jgi:hypothetical protein
MTISTRRHINRLNLRPRALQPISEQSRTLVERMRGQVPQLMPPAGTPSPLLGEVARRDAMPDELSARA